MKRIAKAAYLAAALYVTISPALKWRDLEPSVIQSWPMYVGGPPACTIRFDDPQGRNSNFNRETQALINQALYRPKDTAILLPNLDFTNQLLRGYCSMPTMRRRDFNAKLSCWNGNAWINLPDFGIEKCKD